MYDYNARFYDPQLGQLFRAARQPPINYHASVRLGKGKSSQMEIYGDRANFLSALPSELMSIRNPVRVFNHYFKKYEKKGDLQLSDELEGLWADVIHRSPRLNFPPLAESLPFDHKVTLVEWINDLAPRFGDSLLGHPLNIFIPPSDLQALEVWRNPDSFCHLAEEGEGRIEYSGEWYWHPLYLALDNWWRATQASLETVEWAKNSETISLILKGSGSFRSIEEFSIARGAGFWSVSFQGGNPAYLPGVSTAILLNAQLLAQHANNTLTPVELRDGQLTLELKVCRADNVISPPQPVLLPADERLIQHAIDYIIALVFPAYREASQQLETVLASEVSRLEPYVLKGDIEQSWFSSLQGVQRNLASIRETFTGYYLDPSLPDKD